MPVTPRVDDADVVFRSGRWRLTRAARRRQAILVAALEAERVARAAAVQELAQRRRTELERRLDRLERQAESARLAGELRRSLKLRSPANDFTWGDWLTIRRAWGERCVYCGGHETQVGSLTQDHVVPLVDGGAHSALNIVPACRHCNAKKGRRQAPPFVITPTAELYR